MKILLLTTHLEIGGIPIYVTNLARGLKRQGHQPVVVSDRGWLQRRLEQDQIPYRPISCRTSNELDPKLWLRALPELFAIIRQEKPDLIHAHTRVTQVLGRVLNLCTGIPYVTTSHGLYRFRIGRRLFRCWGETVMAISNSSMSRLVRQYKLSPPYRVTLVENGVDVDHFLESVDPDLVARFRQEVGLMGDPIIGAIARLSPVKGLDLLIKAVPGLLKNYPHLQLLIVGEGPVKQDLVRLAYELGIAEHVVIAHPVDDTRIPLAAMDLFAAPSHQEGFGLSVVEAMAAGVPVVASNTGGLAEIIEDKKSGLLVPAADEKALEEALSRLLGDSVFRGQIASAGREKAKAQYDMKRVVEEVEKVYAKAVA